MTAEVLTERAFTPKQLENQRLFSVGPGAAMPEQPGDKGKRVARKLFAFTGGTGIDLLESGIFEHLTEPWNERLREEKRDVDALQGGDQKQAQMWEYVQKKTKNNVVGFVEDGISDEVYVIGMNAILRNMTGLNEVSYPSATARFISNWTNLLSWTSGKFNEKDFWKKPWNFINAVNTEAFISLLEEAPIGIGKTVSKVHKAVDEKLTKSELVQLVNGAALAAVSAINITKNMIFSDVKRPTNTPTAME